MEQDKCTLCGECRGCPAWIDIPRCIEISRNGDHSGESRECIRQIHNCIHCNRCTKKCPEGIQVRELVQEIFDHF